MDRADTRPALADEKDPRYKGIDRVLKRLQFKQDALIEVLTSAQQAFGYLPEEAMIYIARKLKLPFSWVYGVASFYPSFSLSPMGRHSAIVCLGTACYVGRSLEIMSTVSDTFGLEPGHTTADGQLSLGATRCLGCCSLAPVLVLDDKVLGNQTPESATENITTALSGDGQPTATGGSARNRE